MIEQGNPNSAVSDNVVKIIGEGVGNTVGESGDRQSW